MKIKQRTANKVLPKAGLTNFYDTFVQGSTFVLRLNFCAKNPRLRQYLKRYMLCYQNSVQQKKNCRNLLKKRNYNFYSSNAKFILFFQHLFCQRTSAHLQNANAKSITYFAKEPIFPLCLLFLQNEIFNLHFY